MGADGVEIPKQDSRKIGVRGGVVAEDLFDHDFCPAVWIGRDAGGHGFLVGDGVLGAVDRGGRRKYKAFTAKFFHDLQQRERGIKIIAIIRQRKPTTFTDGLIGGKVNDGIDGMLPEGRSQSAAIRRVDPIEERTPAGDMLQTVEHACLCVVEVIGDDDRMTGI